MENKGLLNNKKAILIISGVSAGVLVGSWLYYKYMEKKDATIEEETFVPKRTVNEPMVFAEVGVPAQEYEEELVAPFNVDADVLAEANLEMELTTEEARTMADLNQAYAEDNPEEV